MKGKTPQQLHIFHRMHSTLHLGLMFLVVVALAFLITALHPGILQAGPSDNVTGWAWSGVAGGGWISLNSTNQSGGTNYGVNIDDTSGAWSGQGWSSNVGWIEFGSNSCGSGVVTDMTTGTTTGWAKVVAANNAGGFSGCISMSGSTQNGTPYGVSMNTTTGIFSGFAWSGDDVVADLNGDGINDAPYASLDGDPDVGLGWIDFSYAQYELVDDAMVDLVVTGQCNDDVTFDWTLTNVDESTCELYYVTSTDPATPILVPNFDPNSPPLTEYISGPNNTNLKFGMVCEHAVSGEPVASPASQIACTTEVAPMCDNGWDDDGDGDTDGADLQCQCTNNVTEYGTCFDCTNNPTSPLCQTEGNVPPVYIES